GTVASRTGEPIFLNPLFVRTVQKGRSEGIELCLPEAVCMESFTPVAYKVGGSEKTIGYIRIGFLIDNGFAREVRLATGADFILLRRERGLASSLPPEKFTASVAHALADAVSSAAPAPDNSEHKLSSFRMSGAPYAIEPADMTDPSDTKIAKMVIARNTSDIAEARKEALRLLVFAILFSLIVAVTLGVVSASRISRSLAKLLAAVKEITEGKLDIRMPDASGRGDEIDELAGAFDEMARSLKNRDEQIRKSADELRDNQDQLIQSGKLAAIGELAAGVAHEIGNPLSAISGYAQMIQEKITSPDENAGFAKEIERETEFIERIIQDLLEFSRPSANLMEPSDTRELAESAIKTASAHKAFSKITVERKFAPDIPLLNCYPKEIQQVFLNLIMNAAQAMPEGGKIRIDGQLRADHVLYRIRDEGPGIPHELRNKVFNPFFTTKPPGVGTGLGLAITYRIIEKHGGILKIEDTPIGASLVFTLPLPEVENG
ncbi:MAG TPA: ATP-binding protein, partial [bacterium]|nr:ATP-binding protein [bacterium]